MQAENSRPCTCGHLESEHFQGECTVIRGSALDFCPCDEFTPAEGE